MRYLLLAMVLGVVVGYAVHSLVSSPEQAAHLADQLSILPDIFLRLIKMIIAPLVFSTLVTGIAHVGDGAALGRMGGRTLLWFIGAGLVSLSLGIVMVHLFEPGVGLNLALPTESSAAPVVTEGLGLRQFITHLVPRSIVEAMATNEILQIVVFSTFLGVALSSLGARAAPLVRGIEALAQAMLVITGYVMWVAPIAVAAAVAAVVMTQGAGVLVTFGKFIGSFYLALATLWILMLAVGYAVLGRPVLLLVRAVREPLLLAFATASSEAAYPKTLDQLTRVGVPDRIASLVLPLGYSFNLDGSMMYCSFALLFIAQAYGIDLTVGQQITMLLLLMATSKGMAGVPRASLVVIAAALPHFGLPEAGLLLILGIDHLLDMGRTATNVIGNSLATAVVAKWEGYPLRREVEDGPLSGPLSGPVSASLAEPLSGPRGEPVSGSLSGPTSSDPA